MCYDRCIRVGVLDADYGERLEWSVFQCFSRSMQDRLVLIGKIAANEALMHLKRQQLVFTDQLPDVSEEPEEPDVGQVPLEVLQRMIGELPPGYRAVFNLYVFEQQSHHEIARQLNISEGTSASQLLRAKRQLARKIKEYIKSTNE